MTTINLIREQLIKPSVKKSRKRSLELAREGIKLTSPDRLTEWFLFRFLLAQMLIKRGKTADIEEAIEMMEEVKKRVSRQKNARKLADAHLILGMAFERILDGDRRINLKRVLREYSEALKFYSKSAYPDLWATIKYALGANYSLLENGNRLNNIRKAIQNYQDALQVFTAKKHPEKHNDIEDALKELDQEQKALSKE